MNILDQEVMKTSGSESINRISNNINDFINSDIERKCALVDRVTDRTKKLSFSKSNLIFINEEEKIKYYLCIDEVMKHKNLKKIVI